MIRTFVIFIMGALIGGGAVFWVLAPSQQQNERIQEVVRVTDSGETHTFTHPVLGFSITYPNTFTPTEYDEGEGARTIVFQHPGEEMGFQMFILPYSEDAISAERIQKDISSGVVEDPQEVVIGGGILATVFWSESALIGRSREVWFIHDGYLYEVTGYASQDALLAQILATLTFTGKK